MPFVTINSLDFLEEKKITATYSKRKNKFILKNVVYKEKKKGEISHRFLPGIYFSVIFELRI